MDRQRARNRFMNFNHRFVFVVIPPAWYLGNACNFSRRRMFKFKIFPSGKVWLRKVLLNVHASYINYQLTLNNKLTLGKKRKQGKSFELPYLFLSDLNSLETETMTIAQWSIFSDFSYWIDTARRCQGFISIFSRMLIILSFSEVHESWLGR